MGVSASRVSPAHRRFFQEVKEGHGEEVAAALAKHPELLRRTTFSRHESALHLAAALGHADMLSHLIAAAAARLGQRGSSSPELLALINAGNDRKQTPLMLAAYRGHLECVELLLQQGADPWVTDNMGGRTALHYAALRNNAAIIDALVGAAERSRPAVVPFPNCESTCYVNMRTLSGFTAMHYAALSDAVHAARTLAAAGANLIAASLFDSFDSFTAPAGSTPLHIAARQGHTAFAKALLQAHAEGWGRRQAADPRLLLNTLGVLPAACARAAHHLELARVLLPTTPLATIFSADELRLYGPPKLQLLAAVALRAKLAHALDRAEAQLAAPQAAAQPQAQQPRPQAQQPRPEQQEQQQEQQQPPQGEVTPAPPTSCGGASCGLCSPPSVHELACEEIEQQSARLAHAKQADKAAHSGGHRSRKPASAPPSRAPSPAPASVRGVKDVDAHVHDVKDADAHVHVCSAEADTSCNVCLDAAPDVRLAPCGHTMCAGCCRRLLDMDYQNVVLCPFCRAPVSDFEAQPPRCC